MYAELLRSYDEGVAEFLDLGRVKPNTLGNSRMLLRLPPLPEAPLPGAPRPAPRCPTRLLPDAAPARRPCPGRPCSGAPLPGAPPAAGG